jgi:8-hydroxy-5-deazaflavin:NADPH oxidoreductase
MRIGILGTGVVGQTIGTALVHRGHEVRLGSRTANNAKARDWVAANGERASQGTFADAATFGAMVFNCTSGTVSLEALHAAGIGNLAGKIIADVANPLDFSDGLPPVLSICNTDSLAERIQAEFPASKVVKTLNTMSAKVMTDPGVVPGEHDVFVSGNDPEAKAHVRELLQSFGWRNVIDLGDITTARGVEMMLPVWLRLWTAFKTPMINFHVAHQ